MIPIKKNQQRNQEKVGGKKRNKQKILEKNIIKIKNRTEGKKIKWK